MDPCSLISNFTLFLLMWNFYYFKNIGLRLGLRCFMRIYDLICEKLLHIFIWAIWDKTHDLWVLSFHMWYLILWIKIMYAGLLSRILLRLEILLIASIRENYLFNFIWILEKNIILSIYTFPLLKVSVLSLNVLWVEIKERFYWFLWEISIVSMCFDLSLHCYQERHACLIFRPLCKWTESL